MEPFDTWKQDPGWADWRWQLRHAVRDPEVLSHWLGLTPEASAAVRRTALRYPVLATPYYLALADRAAADDPIIRQVLPDPRELAVNGAGSPDPLAERRDSPVPGLIHRYPDRALLLATHHCAVLCRHCMRKRAWQPGAPEEAPPTDFTQALAYLREHTGIREVLISGGDPLLLPEETLFGLLAALQALPHLEIVRLGSRLPVVLPQRLTPEFCAQLGAAPPVWLATQFNHPRELTPETALAVGNLLRAGIPVVNQTVLLRGVNDDAPTLAALCTGLLRQRVKPYYLFHGDPVAGTLHFRTGVERGLELLAELERSVSGLAVPAFAFDLPAGGGKVRLEPPRRCGALPDGTAVYRDREGQPRPYPDGRKSAP
jgi:lysine 2,3-aminomutase